VFQQQRDRRCPLVGRDIRNARKLSTGLRAHACRLDDASRAVYSTTCKQPSLIQ